MIACDASFEPLFLAALDQGWITPHFQPIVSLTDSSIVGFEMLARWHDPTLGEISPKTFFPLVERAELLDRLTEELLRRALPTARAWPDSIFLTLNVSPTQLRGSGLPRLIDEVTRQCGFPHARLHIEITETAIIEDLEQTRAILTELINLGCSIVMDDFGTGYSSLTWLRTLPFSAIKIDAGFVQGMHEQRDSRKIVAAVIGLGHSLGLQVIAEGVEDTSQATLLRRLGCELAQGYLFGRPCADVDAAASFSLSTSSPPRTGGFQPMTLEQKANQIAELYRSEFTAIAFVDVTGGVIAASEAFVDITGADSGSIVGRNIGEVLGVPEQKSHYINSLAGCGEHTMTFEETVTSGRVVFFVVQSVRDEVDELLGYSLLCLDVTDRREAEKAYQIATNLNSRMSWQLDARGLVTAVYGTPEQLADASLETVGGMKWVNYIVPQHRDRIVAAWAHSVATGDEFDQEVLLQSDPGKFAWYRTSMSAEKGADGQILRWHGQSELIQTQKDTENALAEVQEHFQFIYDTCPHVLCLLAPDGKLLKISKSWHEFLGTSPQAGIAATFLERIEPRYRELVTARWQEAVGRTAPYNVDFQMRVAAGQLRWVNCWAVPRVNPDGSPIAWYAMLTALREPRADQTSE